MDQEDDWSSLGARDVDWKQDLLDDSAQSRCEIGVFGKKVRGFLTQKWISGPREHDINAGSCCT